MEAKEETLYLPFRNVTACEGEMMCFERLLKYLLMSWIVQTTVTINYYATVTRLYTYDLQVFKIHSWLYGSRKSAGVVHVEHWCPCVVKKHLLPTLFSYRTDSIIQDSIKNLALCLLSNYLLQERHDKHTVPAYPMLSDQNLGSLQIKAGGLYTVM